MSVLAIGKGILCWEAVLFLEGLLLEVPLYIGVGVGKGGHCPLTFHIHFSAAIACFYTFTRI